MTKRLGQNCHHGLSEPRSSGCSSQIQPVPDKMTGIVCLLSVWSLRAVYLLCVWGLRAVHETMFRISMHKQPLQLRATCPRGSARECQPRLQPWPTSPRPPRCRPSRPRRSRPWPKCQRARPVPPRSLPARPPRSQPQPAERPPHPLWWTMVKCQFCPDSTVWATKLHYIRRCRACNAEWHLSIPERMFQRLH